MKLEYEFAVQSNDALPVLNDFMTRANISAIKVSHDIKSAGASRLRLIKFEFKI